MLFSPCSYKKVCNPLVKQICNFWDEHKLVPTCVPTSHHICSHEPKERCEDVPKEHCYKIPRKVHKEVCKDAHSTYEPTYKPVEPTTFTADSTYEPTFTGEDQWTKIWFIITSYNQLMLMNFMLLYHELWEYCIVCVLEIERVVMKLIEQLCPLISNLIILGSTCCACTS